MRPLSRLFAVTFFGLGVVGMLSADEPAVLPPQFLPPPVPKLSNQQMADVIAGVLRSSGQLYAYRIDVTYQDGTAELDGTVADTGQREEAARLTRGVPGVKQVTNRLQITEPRLAQMQNPGVGAVENSDPLPPPRRVETTPFANDPVPSFRAAPPPPHAQPSGPPPMPPYAWPSYAPYNNYSRVGYPAHYPPEAMPNIGPFHPFPKAPLGWRNVKLEFDDGHWWMGQGAQKRDWWSVRFW
jgi:hypothetical protein